MSCIPPDQIYEEYHHDLMIYPSCTIGINQERRLLAIVLRSASTAPAPAFVCDEKEAVELMMQLQNSLRMLSLLPVPPVQYSDFEE
jgi:hypothetical protein